MYKKYIIPGIALLIIIILFVMYRNQHRLYQKTLKTNYSLSAQLRDLQNEYQQVRQGIKQMQAAKAAAPLLKGTFIDRKKYFRQNWKNYIHTSLNDYKTGLLGGVKDIKIVVSNNTEFTLDDVRVNLQYFRANGKLFKTEQLDIHKIRSKSSKRISAPDSRRGMSIKLQLKRITSQDMNFCWTSDKKVQPGDKDPYQCAPEANETPNVD